MTPRRLDPDTVEARLALLRAAMDDLRALGEVTAERLHTDRPALRVVERCLTHLVDLAVEVNAHVAGARLGEVPRDLAESFDLAAQAGLVPVDLANSLRLSAGMRNVIVHSYAALDLEIVAAAVPLALDDYGRYVRSVASFLLALQEVEGEA